jgi:hypothetical protein
MSTGLYIVIFGGGSLHHKEGTMPSVDDVQEAVQIAEDNKVDLSIHIIDENLNYATRLASGQPSLRGDFIPKDATRIKGYGEKVKCHVNSPWELEDVIPKESETVTIKNTSTPVIYLSYTDKSSYEIMNSIGSYELANRWFFVSRKRVSLVDLVSDYFSLREGKGTKYLLPEKLYDLYSGDVLAKELYDYDIVEVKKQLEMACIIIDEYFKGGFNVGENRLDVKSFALNSETSFIKGICFTYGLLTPIPDKNNFIEIRQNSGFRKQLWNLIARVLSNFAINNKLITVEEAAQYGGWNDQRVYILIHSRLTNVKYRTFEIPEVAEQKEIVTPIPLLKVPTLEEIFGSINIELPKAKTASSEGTAADVTFHMPEIPEEGSGSGGEEFSGDD